MATGGFALEGTVGSFEHANGEATESAIPIVALEASFGSATSAAFESVIKGPTVGRHDRVFARIDQRFKDLLSTGRLHEERFFVTRAQQHWSRAKAVVEIVLTLAPAERFTSGLNLLQQYKHEIDTASAALVHAAHLSEADIRRELASANVVHGRAVRMLLAMSALGLIAALVLSRRLSTSVLRPLRLLRDGAKRLGKGELSHRIDALRGAPELEEVGGRVQHDGC